jgi:hypothetical protein
MLIKPGMKGAVGGFEFEYLASVIDGGINFKTMANNSRVLEQSCPVFRLVRRHAFKMKTIKSSAKPGLLSQNNFPTQSRLINFKDQPLQQGSIRAHGTSIMVIMIATMDMTEGERSHQLTIGLFFQRRAPGKVFFLSKMKLP